MKTDTSYKIIKKIDKKYFKDIYQLFQETYWTTSRKKEDIEKVISNTDFIVGVLNKEGNLVGIARVITDFTYIALLCDVMVLPKYHGRGYGKALINAVCNDEKIKKIEQFELYCKNDKVSFYEKWGLEKREDLNFMRKMQGKN
jgi:N-acetylglutamate synthase-like GNAT family acetyltransferase